ncbi:MAG: hypothetical protein LBT25_12955, partial [Candidatus Symbiothrix sp.]|nr:hypothetical protein [Candidatus Symbiothrix sp.]
MKKVKVKEVMVALLFIAVGGNYEAKAQVTIGSDILPEKGALLELKTLAPSPNIPSVTDPGNVTVDASGGGLGLPRVQLADRANLEPFISATDPDWLANT